MKKLDYGSLVAAGIAFVIGSAGGYAINELERDDRITELEQEIAQIKKVQRQPTFEVPNDSEASAAIAKSGRRIHISECKPRQTVPGVTCTGIITTTNGSFAGTTQPGTLSFAKIDSTWVQIQ